MKRRFKTGICILLGVLVFASVITGNKADAASKNRRAGRALAAEVKKGRIKVDDKDYFGMVDVTGDGVRDLIVRSGSRFELTIWSYQNGTVKKIPVYEAEDFTNDGFPSHVYYLKKSKRLWCKGGAVKADSGLYLSSFKISSKKATNTVDYSLMNWTGKYEAEKTLMNEDYKRVKIKKSVFDKQLKDIKKNDCLKQKLYTKKALIKKLKKW